MNGPIRCSAMALVIALAVHSPAYTAPADKQPIRPAKIDETVHRAMQAFDVPGAAVGIVKDGKVVYAKGFGVRTLGQPEAVTVDTIFQIGSNTKAFTAAALAILVDEGKIKWDDPVTDYLPQFKLYDPYVTREFTIRDLLSHRSGLGLGAGDLMIFPETDFTRAEVIHGLRFLKPVSSFRSKYDYDNLLYMVAGEVVASVSGRSWEDFIEQRILAPLKIRACAATYDRIRNSSDIAAPHSRVNGKLITVPVENIAIIGGAGTINCNLSGMTTWLQTQLANGKSPDGQVLFSPERSNEMWSMNTIVPVYPFQAEMFKTHFRGYGMGWELQDTFGYKRVSHTGGVPGTVTWVSMIPELNLGVVVLTNTDNGAAMEAIGMQILDAYLGAPKRDWVDTIKALAPPAAPVAAPADSPAPNPANSLPPLALAVYTGTYVDPWRGAATVQLHDDKLVLKISRTDKLEGTLTHTSGNVFIVHWNNRQFNADAYVRFSQDYNGNIEGMTLRAVSPETDFSFDFQDLNFVKQ